MIRFRLAVVAALALGVTALFSAGPVSATPSHSLPPQAAAHVFKTKGNARPNRTNNLVYHGGVGGIGVDTTPKVYLVLWGSQWTNNDPSGEASRVQSFLQGVGGSSWLNSVTQYCQGVAVGTIFCGSGGQHAGNPSGILAGTWSDNGSAAPSSPTQSQLAAEAVRAAQHFGNTTGSSNASAQYVVATAHGTNAGQTIVEGHELAETITDQFPNGGWLDRRGEENGDKCAWISSGQGASSNVRLSTGTFPVQSLWSNAFNGGSGGCVLSY